MSLVQAIQQHCADEADLDKRRATLENRVHEVFAYLDTNLELKKFSASPSGFDFECPEGFIRVLFVNYWHGEIEESGFVVPLIALDEPVIYINTVKNERLAAEKRAQEAAEVLRVEDEKRLKAQQKAQLEHLRALEAQGYFA